MNTDDLQTSAAAPVLIDIDTRRYRPGTALGRLRCWRDLRRSGAPQEAREAALAGLVGLVGLVGPINTDPLDKEQ